MTAHLSTESPAESELEDIIAAPQAYPPLERRLLVIADVLTAVVEHDGVIMAIRDAIASRLGQNLDTGRSPAAGAAVARPGQLMDALAMNQALVTQIATLFYPAAAALADKALDFNPEWEWTNWTYRKQADMLRRFFDEAGVGDRFVPRSYDANDEPTTD